MADTTHPQVTDRPKKRQNNGRERENQKKMRLSGHLMGAPCQCTRLRCFEVTSLEERQVFLDRFNALPSKNEQDGMLAAMITVMTIKQRRPRAEEDEANLHHNSYRYHLIINGERRQICFKACLSIFGITKSRLERIQKSLATTGLAPLDQRGKHQNRPKAFDDDKRESIINHIRSFRGRQSHYTLHDSKKLYLPEELNLSLMHSMYLAGHPGQTCSRESYRRVFVEKFNVSFGYPRKDTCSTCDFFKTELLKDHAAEHLQKLTMDRELHWRKGQVFYERKTAALLEAQASDTVAAAAFDFWKNLPSPNVTTNDVYYKRQLSTYTFNVHNLGANEVTLYSYDETVGKKGANDVASMLLNFCTHHLPAEVLRLQLFCDSCPGQNKNWTILRFLHYMVHHKRRFDYIKLTFPIRGHSYMECDRDMVLINQKLPIETPSGWHEHFAVARRHPSPFNVVRVDRSMLLGVEQHIKNFYPATCPVKTQPLREVVFTLDHPRLMQYRESWNGPYSDAVITKAAGKRRVIQASLQPSNHAPVPIPQAKYKDLQDLKRFCSQEAQEFFSGLPHSGQPSNADHSDIDDEEEEES